MSVIRVDCGCIDAPCCGCDDVAYTGQDALDRENEELESNQRTEDDNYWEDGMTDVEADADTLASAGYGTDEDYRGFEYADEERFEADCGDC